MKVQSQKIVLDIMHNTSQNCWSNRYETGVREIEIYVVSDGNIFDLTNIKPTLFCINPFGDKIHTQLVVTNASIGKISISIPEKIAEYSGVTKCCMSFTQGNQLLISADFNIVVNKTVYNIDSEPMIQELGECLSEYIQEKPLTPTSDGNKGEQYVDSEFIYMCIDTNSWVRLPIDTTWGLEKGGLL